MTGDAMTDRSKSDHAMSDGAMARDTMTHEDAEELLPWLANGTLAGADRARVERHVRACVTCRAELAEQRALAALVRRQPAVHVSVERNFDVLRRRIDEGRPTGGFGRFGRRVRWAAAAAAGLVAVAVMLAPEWLGEPLPSDERYRTLTGDAPTAMLVDVVFADAADAEIRELLARHDVEIVSGPSPRVGRYTLRVAGDRMPERDIDELLHRLREDPIVRFAARAYSAPSEETSDGGVAR